jgi:hypothetical protein
MEVRNYNSDSYKQEPGSLCPDKIKTRSRAVANIIAGICLALGCGSFAYTQTNSPTPNKVQKERAMTMRASGTFEVKLTSQDDKSEDAKLGRMTIDKQFHGDLAGTSRGQMLSAMTEVQGSAGYVAIEKISGALQGRKGSFVLQHSGTMTRGEPQLSVTVVPDSGTGELVGLTGKMIIKIADGKHYYDFEYTLAKTP